jgi:hypothetical protein
MKNEYGLKCPVFWADVLPEHEWVATDANGEVWSYKDKPKIKNNQWQACNYSLACVSFKGLSPADFKKCLWKRPKTQSE